MDLETFLIAVYCVCDDFLAGCKLRTRGPDPTLDDSEVLTMEIAGEFLGQDTDTGILRYFRLHHRGLFPRLGEVHRTTFARQAANLWAVKEQLWRRLQTQVSSEPALSILDSFPVPVCRFARAKRCHTLGDLSTWGYDAVAHGTFFGYRVHVRITWPGIISDLQITPGNASDLTVAPELLLRAQGWALGDRGYWSRALRADLKQELGIELLAPFQRASQETEPWPFWLFVKRRRVETVIGQLVARFQAKRNWARDRWHLCSRWLRKVLSHTIAVLFCQKQGLEPLQMSLLLR
jgi:hypothetical protein